MPRKLKTRKARPAESAKISKLVREGVPQKQAVATALSMKRAGRLTPGGGYIRAGSHRGKGRRRSRGRR